MILNFLALCFCQNSYVLDIKNKIDKLHSLTSYSTFYDFFGVKENAPLSEINKAFRKLKRSNPPSNLTASQFEDLLMDGYNLLNKARQMHDAFLADSLFYYIDNPINYKNYFAVSFLAVLCALIGLDFIIYAIRYLKFIETVTAAKENKENAKKITRKERKRMLNSPQMYSKMLFNAIIRKIKRN